MKDQDRIAVPIQFLPAFELVARELSIKRAAHTLHLTPSAVSQQIRALEQALGFPLFRRATRALALTPEGEQFARVVGDTLGTLRSGTARLMRKRGPRPLRLSTESFVAHEVLIPELHALRERDSRIDLRLETSIALADLNHDGVDVAVRYGIGPWPGLAATLLTEVIMTPVCAPELIPGGQLGSARALESVPLIRVGDFPDPWDAIARRSGLKLRERLVFDTYSAALRAAEQGLGLVFGLFPLTSARVLEGRLVTPIGLRVRTRASFQFVCRKADVTRPDILAVRDWCVARFAALPALPEDVRASTVSERPVRGWRRARD
jgi:LysR family transcriptional regulator, glycine cleavage system transcriptional activator